MSIESESTQTELEQFIIKRLNKLMEERGLSRYKLGKLCDVTQASLSTILSGKCAPSIVTIEKICNGLDISVSDFFKSGNEVEYTFSNEDVKVLTSWNKLSNVQKQIVFAYAEGMIAQNRIDNKK